MCLSCLQFYDSNNLPLDVSTDHIYEGEVIGDRNSYVFGSILDGVFEGKIITERDAYYVEHAKRYFPTTNTTTATANGAQMPTAQRRVAEEYLEATSTMTTTTTSSTTTTAETTTTARMTRTSDGTVKASPTSGGNHKNEQTDDNRNTGYHSIIYKESHVDDAYKDLREGRACHIYVYAHMFLLSFLLLSYMANYSYVIECCVNTIYWK